MVNNNLNTKLLAHNVTTTEIDNAVTHLTDVLRKAIKKSILMNARTSKLMQITPSTKLQIQKRKNFIAKDN